jgi:hypothetical protein
LTKTLPLRRPALWLTLAILGLGPLGPTRAGAADAKTCPAQAAGAPCDPCSVDPSICKRPPLPPRCVERPDGPGCDPCWIDPSGCKRPAPPTPCAKIGGCKPCWIEPWLCNPPTEPPPEDGKAPKPQAPVDHSQTWLPNGSGGGIY